MLTDKELTGLAMLMGVSKKEAAFYVKMRLNQKARKPAGFILGPKVPLEDREAWRKLLTKGWLQEGKERNGNRTFDAYSLAFEGKAPTFPSSMLGRTMATVPAQKKSPEWPLPFEGKVEGEA
jgi:hypothetical protein